MNESISSIRKEYSKESLDETALAKDPVVQFHKWFDQAIKSEVNEPNAMNLATLNDKGGISSRIVLVKDIDSDGLVFYTNYESEKGIQLAKNPQAAVNFFWPELERQVRIEGKVEKVNNERSDEYFNSRPRASQIGAWVSPQSEQINDRSFLENREVAYELKFDGQKIPRPAHWGGYKMKFEMIEFWQGRPSRLHDRFRYQLIKDKWQLMRLAP